MNTPESDEALIPDEPHGSPGRTLGRVYAALRGEFDADQLEPDEARIFSDLWVLYMAGPNPERDAFVAKMFAEGGYVGEMIKDDLSARFPEAEWKLLRIRPAQADPKSRTTAALGQKRPLGKQLLPRSCTPTFERR